MFSKKTTINTTPTPHKTLHKKIRTLINSLHLTPPTLLLHPLLASQITSFFPQSSRTQEAQRRTKGEENLFFSSLSCSSIVAIEFHKKGSTLLFSSTQLIQGKINSFIHSVFLFRFFIIFGKKYIENHILNCFHI